MNNYRYITEETQDLFLQDLSHAYQILKPPTFLNTSTIINASTELSEQIPHIMPINQLYRANYERYQADFEHLCSHPFFHFPKCPDYLTTMPESSNLFYSNRFSLRKIIYTILLDAALLTCFNVLFQILLPERVRLSICNQHIKQPMLYYSAVAAVYDPSIDNITKSLGNTVNSKDCIKDTLNCSDYSYDDYPSELRNMNDQAKRLRNTMKAYPLLQQLFSITNEVENCNPQKQSGKNPSPRSLSMKLPLSQYLIFNRVLSIDLRCIKTVLNIYSDNTLENTDENKKKAKIRMDRSDCSSDMIQYKLGYFSLGNRAFDETLLPDNTPYTLNTTANTEVLFQDELLIYLTMESTFHCELTEMMAKKYNEVQKKNIWLKERNLLEASFFGIFNNLPNYLTRSIFVNYSFLTLEQICQNEDEYEREQKINEWKEQCTSFVSEISDCLFPKILWSMLIDLFCMNNPDFMPSNPSIDSSRLRMTFLNIFEYLDKERITNILAPLQQYINLYDDPHDHRGNELPQSVRDNAKQIKTALESLCLSDSSPKEAPLNFYKSIIQATDFSRSQQLLPPLP